MKKKAKVKGLLLTEEIRKALYLSVEEAIRCHTSAMEREVAKKEKEARKERIRLYKKVQDAYRTMTENRAKEILFSKYGPRELSRLCKDWRKPIGENRCPDCAGTGKSGEFDRCVPPNEYDCENCDGKGII